MQLRKPRNNDIESRVNTLNEHENEKVPYIVSGKSYTAVVINAASKAGNGSKADWGPSSS